MPELERYSPDPSLTPDQHHVLSLLAEGKSIHDAAEAVGIHRNTIRNWRRAVPAFAREAEFAIREQAAAWHDQALRLAPRANSLLEELLNDPVASPALRVRIALAVLKTAADPHPKALPIEGTLGSELEALHGARMARVSAVISENVQQEIPKPCTTVHNPNLGRNSACPCGSGQKYKRCCAPYAPPKNAVPVHDPELAASVHAATT